VEILGPAPVRHDAAAASLSDRRSRILESLQQSAAPTTVAALAGQLGLHQNTVREHLDALVERDLATRALIASVGRGRPAWSYAAATDHVEPDARVRDYAGLATALAGHIARTSDDPTGDALSAGRFWGQELAVGDAARSPAAARRRVIELLAGLGFDPTTDARVTKARLRQCPLLDAARANPDVVCSVHLGIVHGALDALGGESEGTTLTPFAEPGACLLHLAT